MPTRTLPELILEAREAVNTQIELVNDYSAELDELRKESSPDPEKIADLRSRRAAVKAKIPELERSLAAYEADHADDERMTRDANSSHRTDAGIRFHGGAEDEPSARWIDANSGKRAALAKTERFGSHPAFEGQRNHEGDDTISRFGSIGQLARAMSTTSGSAIVPTVWADDIIDRVRNASVVLQAGATVVPMGAKTVQIGRLTTDPTAAFRLENSAITASDPVFDNVTLTANTLSALVIGSMEWFQDADNVDNIVSDAIAKAIALRIDLVALYGGITAGAGSINLATPPNPRGILAALNALLPANVLGAATNGTTQTAAGFYNEIIDTIYKVRDANEEPNAYITNTKLARTYAKAYDTTSQPLQVPPAVAEVKRYVTNQIPSYTQGTLTTATDVFAGDFTQLLIGQRLGLTLQFLTERYADMGQIGIVAHWRGDVQPARPSAFAVYKALKGEA